MVVEEALLSEVTHLLDTDGRKINPATEENQFQQDTHWEKRLTASGVLKAEESGKKVVLTDIIAINGAGAVSFYIREKNASGAIRLNVYHNQNYTFDHTFRQGLEGAAYDGSNAGDLYFDLLVAGTEITCTGYMKEA